MRDWYPTVSKQNLSYIESVMDESVHPMNAKKKLAHEVVSIWHDSVLVDEFSS